MAEKKKIKNLSDVVNLGVEEAKRIKEKEKNGGGVVNLGVEEAKRIKDGVEVVQYSGRTTPRGNRIGVGQSEREKTLEKYGAPSYGVKYEHSLALDKGQGPINLDRKYVSTPTPQRSIYMPTVFDVGAKKALEQTKERRENPVVPYSEVGDYEATTNKAYQDIVENDTNPKRKQFFEDIKKIYGDYYYLMTKETADGIKYYSDNEEITSKYTNDEIRDYLGYLYSNLTKYDQARKNKLLYKEDIEDFYNEKSAEWEYYEKLGQNNPVIANDKKIAKEEDLSVLVPTLEEMLNEAPSIAEQRAEKREDAVLKYGSMASELESQGHTATYDKDKIITGNAGAYDTIGHLYHRINGKTYFGEGTEDTREAHENGGDVENMMYAGEKQIFNTLVNAGKYNEAYEFYNQIRPDLEVRAREYEIKQETKYAQEHPWIAGFETTLSRQIYEPMEIIDDIGDVLTGKEINPYDASSRGIERGNVRRSVGAETIAKDNGIVAKYGYNAAMTISDMAVDAAVAYVTGGGNAASVAAKYVRNARMFMHGYSGVTDSIKLRGGSDAQAILGGVLAGSIEVWTESFTWDKIMNGSGKGLKGFIKAAGKEIVPNGIEELSAEGLNIVSDALVMQNNSESSNKVSELVMSGMSADEANKIVFKENTNRLIEASVLGGLTGGTMAGGMAVVNGAMSYAKKDNYMTAVAGEMVEQNPLAFDNIMYYGASIGNENATKMVDKIENGLEVIPKEAGEALSSVIEQSLEEDGGIMNIMNLVSAVDGKPATYEMEALDTAKAIIHMVQKKASDVDKALISRSKGATTVLSAIEGNKKALDNIKNTAVKELKPSAEEVQTENKYSAENVTISNGNVYTRDGKKVTITKDADIENGIVLSGEQKRFKEKNAKGYKVLEKWATELKKPVKLVKGLYDEDGKIIDGVETSDAIYINTEATNPVKWAASHEFSHTMKKSAGEAWAKYENYVINKKKKDGSYYRVFKAKAKAYGTDNVATINEEIAADYIGDAFDSVEELADFIKKDRGLAIKVRDIYYKALDKLNLLDEKKKAQLMWRDAYREAVLNVAKQTENQTRKSVDERKSVSYGKTHGESGSLSLENENPNALTAEKGKAEKSGKSEPRFKYSGKTKNGIKKSISGTRESEIEAQYLELAKNPEQNEAELDKMVYEAAKEAGYTEKVYHGTTDFGFTRIKTSKSDDFISFFATSSLELANTYSGVLGETSIKKGNKGSVENQQRYERLVDNFVNEVNEIAGRDTISKDSLPFDDYLNKIRKGKMTLQQLSSKMSDYVLDVIDEIQTQKKITKEEERQIWQMSTELETALYGLDGRSGNYGMYANTDNFLIIEGNGARWSKIPFDKIPSKTTANTREITAWAKGNGYDGVVFKDIYDVGNHGTTHGKPANVYAFLKPETQLKSADPVTYNVFGKAIPLSKRFNKNNNDLRYSRPGTRESEISDSLKEENARLRNELENAHIQLNQAEGKGIDVKEVKRVAQDFRKQYGSKVKLSELHQDLTKLYNLMQSDKATADEVSQRVSEIADKVIDKATQTVTNDEYSELLDRIKNTKIMVPELERADFRDGYETFRKGNMGKITLVNDGTDLDVFWDELTEEYPNLFDEDILGSEERLERILDVREEFAPREESAFASDEEKEQARVKLKNDIMDAFYDIPEGESGTKYVFYDKRVAGVEKELADTSNKLDLSNKKTTRAGIDSDFNYLSQMVKNPTDNKHVPEDMRAGVAALLRCFNYETKYLDKLKDAGKEADSPTAVRISDMYNAYTNIIKKSWGIEATENSQFADQFLTDDLKEMIGDIPIEEDGNFKRLEDMSIEELRSMAKVLRSVHHTITQRNKAFNTAIKEEISELGFNAAEDFKSTRARRKGSGEKVDGNDTVLEKAVQVVDKYFNYDNVQPWDFFHEMGGTMERLFMEERKGFDKHILNLKRAAEAMQKATEGIDLDKVTGKGAPKIRFKTSFDEELVLSKGQILSLYALYNRKQGKEHILGGGIVTGKKYYNADGQKGSANTAHPITEADLGKLFDENISSEEKKMVKAVVEFMSKECAKWGNETSMKLYGYEKFGESWYFPIKVSDQTLNTYYGEKGEGNQRTQGFTKKTTKNASNAVKISDFFDTVTSHINGVSLYNSTALPMLDMERVLNYNESGSNVKVRADLIRTFGKNAEAYIEKFHKDENGSTKTEKSALEKLGSLNKKASIGFNARVLVQQPTSIARAYMFLSPKDIPASLKGAAMIKEMREVCPIAYWKSLGFRDIGTGSSLKTVLLDNESLYSKAEMGMYGLADDFTWGLIYGAVKNETIRKNPDLKVGSKEFNEKVRDRFNYIVDRTQVVDSVFHRTQNMRSDNALVKNTTMFMSEALKTYNLYRTEMKDAVKEQRKFKTAARATAVFAASNLLLALAQAIPDAWREDDEKELFDEKGNPIGYWGMYWKKFKEDLLDDVNPLNSFPIIKDVWGIVQGFRNERIEYSRLNDFIISCKNLGNDKMSLPAKLTSLTTSAAAVFGISAGNLKRDVFGFAETIFRANGEEYNDYLIDKFKLNVKSDSNKAKFMRHYERAISNGHPGDAAIILEDYLSENYNGKFDNKHTKTVVKEVSKLYGKTKEDQSKLIFGVPEQKFSFDGEDVKISDKDYPEYVEKTYNTLFDLAYDMINDERYKDLPLEEKVRNFGELEQFAEQSQRPEYIEGYELDGGWKSDLYNGKINYMDSAMERYGNRIFTDKKDEYKEKFVVNEKDYSEAEFGTVVSVVNDWSGYLASKDLGKETDPSKYRYLIVYDEKLSNDISIEEYAGVRAYAKKTAALYDLNDDNPDKGSDSLTADELVRYLDSTDYSKEVKGALFMSIGGSTWYNPYTGLKNNGEPRKSSGGGSSSGGSKSSGGSRTTTRSNGTRTTTSTRTNSKTTTRATRTTTRTGR